MALAEAGSMTVVDAHMAVPGPAGRMRGPSQGVRPGRVMVPGANWLVELVHARV